MGGGGGFVVAWHLGSPSASGDSALSAASCSHSPRDLRLPANPGINQTKRWEG